MRNLILITLITGSAIAYAGPKVELTTSYTNQTGVVDADTTKKSRLKIKPNINIQNVLVSSVPATYSFSSNVQVEIQNYNADGSAAGSAMQYTYHYGSGNYMGMELNILDPSTNTTTNNFTVADFDNNYSVNYMTDGSGTKTGTVSKFDYGTIINSTTDSTTFTIVKTGHQKPLLTYMAEEYIISYTDGTKIQVWASAGVTLDVRKMYYCDRSGRSAVAGFPADFALEMTTIKPTGEKTTWKVLQVNMSASKTITKTDYNFAP